MECEMCGNTFLNSDEFNAHTQRHLLEGMQAYAPFLKEAAQNIAGSTASLVEAIAQRTAELVLARLPGPVFESRPVPKEPNFSFEVMQIAQVVMMNNRSVEEVVTLCRQAQEALG